MATINRLKKRPKKADRSSVSGQIWTHIYNTSRWRRLRQSKLMDQPLCEMCLEEGRVTAAEDVHHKQEISTYDDLERQKLLAFDYDNLMSICHKCHQKLHAQKHIQKHIQKHKHKNEINS